MRNDYNLSSQRFMTELDSPETHIYISTRGYRECLNSDSKHFLNICFSFRGISRIGAAIAQSHQIFLDFPFPWCTFDQNLLLPLATMRTKLIFAFRLLACRLPFGLLSLVCLGSAKNRIIFFFKFCFNLNT